MESLKLDTTQNRNLNFAKFFCAGLLILWGVHFLSATQNPELTIQEKAKPIVKLCKETIKNKPCEKNNHTL